MSLLLRHNNITKILRTYIRRAGGHAITEPHGLNSIDNKRPDILFYHENKKYLIDVTVRHPLSKSNLTKSTDRLSSAKSAANQKLALYKTLAANQQANFIPFAVETYGGLHSSAIQLLDIISTACRENNSYYNPNEIVHHLKYSIAIAIQRGNSEAIHYGYKRSARDSYRYNPIRSNSNSSGSIRLSAIHHPIQPATETCYQPIISNTASQVQCTAVLCDPPRDSHTETHIQPIASIPLITTTTPNKPANKSANLRKIVYIAQPQSHTVNNNINYHTSIPNTTTTSCTIASPSSGKRNFENSYSIDSSIINNSNNHYNYTKKSRSLDSTNYTNQNIVIATSSNSVSVDNSNYPSIPSSNHHTRAHNHINNRIITRSQVHPDRARLLALSGISIASNISTRFDTNSNHNSISIQQHLILIILIII